MKKVEDFYKENKLAEEQNIEALIELADLTRQLIKENEYEQINNIIKYVINKNYYEALTWIMSILQEKYDTQEKNEEVKDFSCILGKNINNFNEFTKNLGVQFEPIKNSIQNIYNQNGEVESFFNISKYKTKYENVFLISSENFDAKDNDYIQYKLLFTHDNN